jgi:hypothetical protein
MRHVRRVWLPGRGSGEIGMMTVQRSLFVCRNLEQATHQRSPLRQALSAYALGGNRFRRNPWLVFQITTSVRPSVPDRHMCAVRNERAGAHAHTGLLALVPEHPVPAGVALLVDHTCIPPTDRNGVDGSSNTGLLGSIRPPGFSIFATFAIASDCVLWAHRTRTNRTRTTRTIRTVRTIRTNCYAVAPANSS